MVKEAQEICNYLLGLPNIKSCQIYGSLANQTTDQYSDIDIEIDVSGCDNSLFIQTLPELLSNSTFAFEN